MNPGFGARKIQFPALSRRVGRLSQKSANRSACRSARSGCGVALRYGGDIVRAGAELSRCRQCVFSKGDIRENAKKLLEAARFRTLTRA